MKSIHIKDDVYAQVDDEDYEFLVNEFNKWYLRKAGPKSARYYTFSKRNRKTIYMHRVVMNAPKGVEVDHINGDGLDNRRSNLRLATRSLNCANRDMPPGETGFRGVYRNHKTRFIARIEVDKKQIALGGYATPEEAAAAYNAAASQYYGRFARLNKIQG